MKAEIRDVHYLSKITQLEECGLKIWTQGAWGAQSVEQLTSPQVTISQFMLWSPGSGSVLTDRSLVPALDSVSRSLSAPSPLFSVSQKQINVNFFFLIWTQLSLNARLAWTLARY